MSVGRQCLRTRQESNAYSWRNGQFQNAGESCVGNVLFGSQHGYLGSDIEEFVFLEEVEEST